MIKRCPSCNRTYSDESISFCLADGALLSAPYGSSKDKDEAPPTEILPAKENPVPPDGPRPIPPTEPAKPVVPTMTSLGGQKAAFAAVTAEPKRRSSAAFIWLAVALLVLGGIVFGIFTVSRVLKMRTDVAATATPDPFIAQQTASPIDDSQVPSLTPGGAQTTATPAPANGNPNRSETPTPSPQAAATPNLSHAPIAPGRAEPYVSPTPETKQPEPIDYNRVFSQREVDVKPQLLEQPKPSYTDAARQNNVQGTVRLRAVLSANGSVGSVSAITGLPNGLTEQAIAAAKRIKFTPAMKDGRQVSVAITLEYHFSVY